LKAWRLESREAGKRGGWNAGRLESWEAGMQGGWKAGRPESRKLIIYYSIEASWLPGFIASRLPGFIASRPPGLQASQFQLVNELWKKDIYYESSHSQCRSGNSIDAVDRKRS
jgi:hypothetical protein